MFLCVPKAFKFLWRVTSILIFQKTWFVIDNTLRRSQNACQSKVKFPSKCHQATGHPSRHKYILHRLTQSVIMISAKASIKLIQEYWSERLRWSNHNDIVSDFLELVFVWPGPSLSCTTSLDSHESAEPSIIEAELSSNYFWLFPWSLILVNKMQDRSSVCIRRGGNERI